jgi:hypothetical protein
MGAAGDGEAGERERRDAHEAARHNSSDLFFVRPVEGGKV